MWYYELNQQPFGPVSKETIAEALRNGKISGSTLVWREGMPEWKSLVETELATLLGVTPPPQMVQTVPMTYQPAYINVPQYTKVQPEALKKLFWWWFGLLVGSLPFYALAQVFMGQSWIVALVCLYSLPMLAATVLQYVVLYKFWQVIQDGHARTIPGKAVGFLFIPIFSYYWLFVAYFGLAMDLNRYIERHFASRPEVTVRRASPVVAITFVIYSLLQIVFVMYIYINILAVSLGSLSDFTQLSGAMLPYQLPTMIFTIVQYAILIAMYLSFYFSAKDIRAAEEK